jgi:hypothetical protein
MNVWKEEILIRGSWIIFLIEGQLHVGRIISFLKSLSSKKTERSFTFSSLSLKDRSNYFMLINPLYLMHDEQLNRIPQNSQNKYFHCNTYICNILNNTVNISVNLARINEFHQQFMLNQ